MSQVFESGDFERLMKLTVQKHIETHINVEIEAAKKRLEEVLRKSVAELALSIMSHYEVRRMENSIVITVKNDAKIA